MQPIEKEHIVGVDMPAERQPSREELMDAVKAMFGHNMPRWAGGKTGNAIKKQMNRIKNKQARQARKRNRK